MIPYFSVSGLGRSSWLVCSRVCPAGVSMFREERERERFLRRLFMYVRLKYILFTFTFTLESPSVQ